MIDLDSKKKAYGFIYQVIVFDTRYEQGPSYGPREPGEFGIVPFVKVYTTNRIEELQNFVIGLEKDKKEYIVQKVTPLKASLDVKVVFDE